ncbi:MAG TPA: ADYC domain-containing protein [Pseudomonadota bacterium]|nr:ADYC domain-containing protein [Pseudomonadota bacterium]
MNSFRYLFFGAAALLAGCSGSATELCPVGADGQPACVEALQLPSRTFQSRTFQGRSFQSRTFQGTQAAVATVQQLTIGGVPVEQVTLQGTVLWGTLGGRAISGADFIGATVTETAPDGAVFDLTISAIEADPQDPSGEVLLYTLTAYNPETGTVDKVCDPDSSGGQWATPVYGSWDTTGAHIQSPTQFMFGCTSGVVAKCVRWGYKPWKSVGGTSLADYHQACTRMARADYCGDGISHTENGTLIDVYDDLGIQVKAPQVLTSPLVFEGAWTSGGAYCLTKDRWLKLLQLPSVTLDCKTKFLNLFPLLETSPVDAQDLCVAKRLDLSRSEVHIDNRSGLNVNLL